MTEYPIASPVEVPAEILFDAIETELERRGVEL